MKLHVMPDDDGIITIDIDENTCLKDILSNSSVQKFLRLKYEFKYARSYLFAKEDPNRNFVQLLKTHDVPLIESQYTLRLTKRPFSAFTVDSYSDLVVVRPLSPLPFPKGYRPVVPCTISSIPLCTSNSGSTEQGSTLVISPQKTGSKSQANMLLRQYITNPLASDGFSCEWVDRSQKRQVAAASTDAFQQATEGEVRKSDFPTKS